MRYGYEVVVAERGVRIRRGCGCVDGDEVCLGTSGEECAFKTYGGVGGRGEFDTEGGRGLSVYGGMGFEQALRDIVKAAFMIPPGQDI